MMKMIHPVAGALGLAMILSFWLSTLLSELFADAATVTTVKTLIPWGFLILVPALALAGMSGFRLGKTWRGPVVSQKRKRMPIIAANGILILNSGGAVSVGPGAGRGLRYRLLHRAGAGACRRRGQYHAAVAEHA